VKTVYLLRHAKSSWDDPGLADFDRPLNDRGRDAARFIGELMFRRGIVPEAIVSSPAKRARQTAALVREQGELPTIGFDKRIYEASPLTLFNLLQETPAEVGSIMIVGHNPGLEELSRLLTGRPGSFPTASLARIDFPDVDWAELSAGSGEPAFVIRPKDLMKR
jgi:phosphohistidine phosphatase